MNEDDRSKRLEILTSAVQKALLSAAKEAVGPLRQLRVVTNQKTGDIRTFARLLVVEKVADKREEISLLDARRIKQQVELGEEVEVDVTPVGFGHVASRFAKQALMEEIRLAEKRGRWAP
jgi:N utilization substance protein A